MANLSRNLIHLIQLWVPLFSESSVCSCKDTTALSNRTVHCPSTLRQGRAFHLNRFPLSALDIAKLQHCAEAVYWTHFHSICPQNTRNKRSKSGITFREWLLQCARAVKAHNMTEHIIISIIIIRYCSDLLFHSMIKVYTQWMEKIFFCKAERPLTHKKYTIFKHK